MGGEIDVPTLNGTTKFSIPAGTQEGTSFRIRNEGIQQFRGSGRGDLFFTVHVEVPKHLGEKQKELLRQFEDSLNGREYERRKSFAIRSRAISATMPSGSRKNSKRNKPQGKRDAPFYAPSLFCV